MVTIDLTTRIQAPITRCFDLARSIDLHQRTAAASQEQAVAGVTSGLISLGQSVRWRARHFGITQHLTIKITAFESPDYFQDTMTEGAFAVLQHDHHFFAIAPTLTEMRDHFVFAAPLGLLGRVTESLLLHRYMQHFLEERNHILKSIAESDDPDTGWQAYLPH